MMKAGNGKKGKDSAKINKKVLPFLPPFLPFLP
jgi:hypothetical protein